ncbi:hypothetical protein BKA69DRAFT_1078407 [Paraphysoderma sedebokerense]|nr:hypothetical protein BKA69DRAFT_1078407 [Paraphysoderma sedebokerense]
MMSSSSPGRHRSSIHCTSTSLIRSKSQPPPSSTPTIPPNQPSNINYSMTTPQTSLIILNPTDCNNCNELQKHVIKLQDDFLYNLELLKQRDEELEKLDERELWWQERWKNCTTQIASLKDTIAQLKEDVASANKNTQKESQQYDEKVQEVMKQSQVHVQKEKKDYEDRIKALQKGLDDQNKKNKHMVFEFEAMEKTIAKLESSLSQSMKSSEVLANEIDRLTKENMELRENSNSNHREIEELCQNLKLISTEKERVEDNNKSLTQQLQHLRTAMTTSTSHSFYLESRIGNLESALSTATTSLSQATQKYESLLASSTTQKKIHEEEISRIKELWKSDIDKLVNEVQVLYEIIKGLEDEKEEKVKTIGQLEGDVNRWRSELEGAKNNQYQQKEENTKLSQQLNQLKQSISHYHDSIKAITLEKDKLFKVNKDLQMRNSELMREMNAIRRQTWKNQREGNATANPITLNSDVIPLQISNNNSHQSSQPNSGNYTPRRSDYITDDVKDSLPHIESIESMMSLDDDQIINLPKLNAAESDDVMMIENEEKGRIRAEMLDLKEENERLSSIIKQMRDDMESVQNELLNRVPGRSDEAPSDQEKQEPAASLESPARSLSPVDSNPGSTLKGTDEVTEKISSLEKLLDEKQSIIEILLLNSAHHHSNPSTKHASTLSSVPIQPQLQNPTSFSHFTHPTPTPSSAPPFYPQYSVIPNPHHPVPPQFAAAPPSQQRDDHRVEMLKQKLQSCLNQIMGLLSEKEKLVELSNRLTAELRWWKDEFGDGKKQTGVEVGVQVPDKSSAKRQILQSLKPSTILPPSNLTQPLKRPYQSNTSSPSTKTENSAPKATLSSAVIKPSTTDQEPIKLKKSGPPTTQRTDKSDKDKAMEKEKPRIRNEREKIINDVEVVKLGLRKKGIRNWNDIAD